MHMAVTKGLFLGWVSRLGQSEEFLVGSDVFQDPRSWSGRCTIGVRIAGVKKKREESTKNLKCIQAQGV